MHDLGFIALGLTAGAANATPPREGDSERTEVAKGTTDAPIFIVSAGGPTTLYVQSLTLKPAASSGWHTHPGPEHSVVTDGTVILQTAHDCAGRPSLMVRPCSFPVECPTA